MNDSHSTDSSNLQDSAYWYLLALLPFGLFLILFWGFIAQPLPWQITLPWVPSLGISLAFRIDGLSLQMMGLITGIGTFVFIYAVGYFSHEPRRSRIFLILPLFMLAMLGAVSADDVILLFAFWELTSVTSFLMVGFNQHQQQAREAARQALLVKMSGGLALLGGLLLLSDIANTRLLSEIIASAEILRDDPRLPYAIILVLIGAFTKSAQFPFHFWLPNAMSAPTPVSAYLHSATMVKLGIYLMARLDPAFNDVLLWEITLISAGTITAVWAAVLALRERDLKRILAHSTVSALGTLTLLIGLPSPASGLAVVTFLFAHALYKAPLFMVAGNIDHATGTRVIDQLMGLRRVMPWSASIAVLAGISMAGLPLAFGFVAKDMISIAKDQADLFSIVSYAFVFVNAIAAAVAGVAAIRVFWGPMDARLGKIREVPWSMLLPPMSIALMGIEFDFFPDIVDPLLLSAAKNISPGLNVAELSTSYAIGKILTATGITMFVGLLMFLSWDRLHNALSRIHWLDSIGPEASYHFLLKSLQYIAAFHTRWLQSGNLDNYLRLTLAALLLILAFGWSQTQSRIAFHWFWPDHAWSWAIAAVLIIAGAVAAVFLNNRIAVLMASGLVGYGAAILFLFSGAPDLAFTQFTVETALVVVAAAVLPHFKLRQFSGRLFENYINLLLAASAGVATFLLLLHLQGFPENGELAAWFGQNSLLQANGRNVVNVIIVDFRAMDTLGEIVVVAFSLLAALPLLTSMSQNLSVRPSSPLLIQTALPIYWLMLAAAVWILLRGHNQPGGGFIAGLVAVAASSLLATIRDPATAQRYQLLSPLVLTMSGIFLAILGGMIGVVSGSGFLRHIWAGGLSSVMLFDLGVMATVWGTLTGYIFALLDSRTLTNQLTTAAVQTAKPPTYRDKCI